MLQGGVVALQSDKGKWQFGKGFVRVKLGRGEKWGQLLSCKIKINKYMNKYSINKK